MVKRMNIDPYYQQQKCSPITVVSGNIRCMWIYSTRWLLWAWASNDSDSTTAFFGDSGGYFFGSVRDKNSNVHSDYAARCWPVIVRKWLRTQISKPRHLLESGYFVPKSVCGQQGCCTLTFVLARLSCCRPTCFTDRLFDGFSHCRFSGDQKMYIP